MNKNKPGCGLYIMVAVLAAAGLFIGLFFCRGPILRHFFPLDYREQVEAIAGEYDIDPWLVFAVIRVESSFNEAAESHAGARGLMQIMPSTASWIADTAGFGPVEEDIWLPEINIRLGCWYIDWLRDYYSGDTVAAVAAYNAGISNVDGWLAKGLWDGTPKTLDNIPFAETRRYITHVYESYEMYRKLYEQ
ncbi:MAG: lytic transglycosylase domain-containing protein [Clostridiales bacterium]|nr:lytic transglycosylase domain-containing protein [Clostridiales bacterium]